MEIRERGSTSAVSESEIDAAIAAIAAHDWGKSRKPLDEIERVVREAHGDEKLAARVEDGLARLLENPAATLAAKGIACRLLWRIGTDRSVPSLAKLLGGDETAEMACYALGRRPSEAAARALREALGRASGRALLATVDLLGERKDAEAVGALADLLSRPEDGPALAAIAALGKIGTGQAAGALAAPLAGPDPRRREAAAHALLRCGREMAARGAAVEARGCYRKLEGAVLPLAVRRGALLGRMDLGGDDAAAAGEGLRRLLDGRP
jgi:HEAT repeat protein